MLKTIKATWLCIKYPFLWPRNRWTGLHYNYWPLQKWLSEFYKKHTHRIPQTFNYAWNNWWAPGVYQVLTWYHNHLLQWLHCFTSYTELGALPKTWVDDWGLEWCKDTKAFLKKEGKLYSYRIMQLKEKWGEFDWLYPPIGAEEIEHKYIERSKKICIECGKPATKVTQGWISYVCDDCAKNHRFVEDIKNN